MQRPLALPGGEDIGSRQVTLHPRQVGEQLRRRSRFETDAGADGRRKRDRRGACARRSTRLRRSHWISGRYLRFLCAQGRVAGGGPIWAPFPPQLTSARRHPSSARLSADQSLPWRVRSQANSSTQLPLAAMVAYRNHVTGGPWVRWRWPLSVANAGCAGLGAAQALRPPRQRESVWFQASPGRPLRGRGR